MSVSVHSFFLSFLFLIDFVFVSWLRLTLHHLSPSYHPTTGYPICLVMLGILFNSSREPQSSNQPICEIYHTAHKNTTTGCPTLHRHISVQNWLENATPEALRRQLDTVNNARRERSMSRESQRSTHSQNSQRSQRSQRTNASNRSYNDQE